MANIKNLNKVIIKAEYSRRYPDPLNEKIEGDSFNIEHHILVSRAIDVPSGISLDPNPREQRTDKSIYKKVKESLEDDADFSFHLKNKGITILAHQVEYSADKKLATVYLAEGDGIVDGGHTYAIIMETQSEERCPEGQYVKFEVITGVPQDMSFDIAGGLNTAVQVDDASLMNLEEKFEWVKKTLEKTPYAEQISYKQFEGGKFDIREILGLMTLFNVNKFPYPQHPKDAYVSKAKCLKLYKDYQASFEMLKPLLKDILYLHDYVHLKSKECYNQAKNAGSEENAKGGKAGKMVGVYTKKERGHDFIFIGGKDKYKLYDGVLYPMLGAMRFLVEQKKGEDVYSWKLKSFDEVKSFFDEIAPEFVTTTYNMSLRYGYKPNPIGKDDTHWDNLYKTVALHFMTNYSQKR